MKPLSHAQRLQLTIHNHLFPISLVFQMWDSGLYGNQSPQKYIYKKIVYYYWFWFHSKLMAQLPIPHLQFRVSIYHEYLFMRVIWGRSHLLTSFVHLDALVLFVLLCGEIVSLSLDIKAFLIVVSLGQRTETENVSVSPSLFSTSPCKQEGQL